MFSHLSVTPQVSECRTTGRGCSAAVAYSNKLKVCECKQLDVVPDPYAYSTKDMWSSD